ncbi:MAG: AAA family ATPase [Spirochaetaceae bacterium]
MDIIRHLEKEGHILTIRDRIGLWRQTVSALCASLTEGEFHRRLSPASFGVHIDNGEPRLSVTDPEKIGPLKGATPPREVWPYAAPEQTGLVTPRLSEATNVYTLGLIGLFLLTGEPALSGDGEVSLLERIVRAEPPVPPTNGLSGESEALLRRVLLRSTAKRPQDRYPSLALFEAGLSLLEESVSGAEAGISPGLIGRDDEYRRVVDFLQRVRRGEEGHLLIVGEPGQGKSYLWSGVVEEQRKEGELWCFYKSPQTGRVPYGGLAAVLRQLLAAAEAGGHPGLTGKGQRTQEIVSFLIPELHRGSRAPEDPGSMALPPEAEYELLRTTVMLCEQNAPVIIALDDIQWIDEQSLSVFESLATSLPGQTALVFIGRPEATARLRDRPGRSELALKGLDEGASRRLLTTLRRERYSGEAGRERFLQVNQYAQGNPLALIHLSDRLESGDPGAIGAQLRTDSDTLLASLARSRLEVVGDRSRRLLQFLSLLLPPVPTRYLRWSASFEEAELSELLEQCEHALLLEIRDGGEMIAFSHDSIETIARSEAVRREDLIDSALPVLQRAAGDGDERALFALAHLLVEEEEVVGRRLLGDREALGLLQAAAGRAVNSRAPKDALRFSEAALSRVDESVPESLRTALHGIAHQAAYALDDVRAMSRHFCRIKAAGDILETNRARRLWIDLAYVNSKFSGAVLIGRRSLRDLGMFGPQDEQDLLRRARGYLRIRPVASVERALLRKPRAEDPASHLMVSIASTLILPVLMTDSRYLALLSYAIFREGFARGISPETGNGFVAWRLWESTERIEPGRVRRMTEAAVRLAEAGGDPIASHSTRTYAAVFALGWTKPYDRGMEELVELYRQGIDLGNFRFASHATHLHVQAQLYHGVALPTVFEAIETGRAEIRGYHHYREAGALAKYAQAVESLMGRTTDPLSLTGSVIDETSYLRDLDKREDRLSREGFFALKGILAIFGGNIPEALTQFRRFDRGAPYTAAVHDNAVFRFFWGFAEFLEGEAEAGRLAMHHLKRWSRAVPENHRHRYLALKGARAVRRGRLRRGMRLLDRARKAALAADYPHDAALIAENHALRLRAADWRRRELLHLAESLYSSWGAVPAAERVRGRLGRQGEATAPVEKVLEEGFVESLLEAPNEPELLMRAVDQIFAFSGAELAFLHLWTGELRELYMIDSRGGRFAGPYDPRGGASALPRMVIRALERPPQSEGGEIAEVVDGAGKARSLATVDRDPTDQCRMRIGLLSAPEGGEFSQLVRTRLVAGSSLVTAMLRLRRVSRKSREQQEDLASARQAVAKAEEYSRTLFGSLPEGLLLLDRRGSVLYYNPPARDYLLFGLELSGLESRPRLEEELQEAVEATLRTTVIGSTGELEIPWRQRELRMLLTAAPAPGEPEETIYAVSIADITEQKLQERSLRRREKELIIADRMSSLGMLSATIAHEVSNPNHIVQLNAQALLMMLEAFKRRSPEVSALEIDEAEQLVEQILDGGHRIEEVVSRVKEYGREGRGDQRERVDVDAVCSRAMRFSRIMAVQYTNNLHYERSGALPPVMAVPGLLEQAIINLIKNGCEALLDSSGRVRLATAFDKERREVLIQVSDDGSGLPEGGNVSIGEPFSSSRADLGGTGLGLSIVQTILEAHGGTLVFREGQDYTTVAEMRLPVVET